MNSSKILLLFAVSVTILTLFAFSVAPAINNPVLLKEDRKAPAVSTQGTFAYVSEFNSGGDYADYGWSLLNGAPSITNSVNYFGEPSLGFSSSGAVWTQQNITAGGQFFSFQYAVNSANGNGSFTITDPSGVSIATITSHGNSVSIFASDGSSFTGTAPSGSAYTNGWQYISGNLYNTSTNKQFSWTLQVFVDQTNSVFATVSVPLGYAYGGIQLTDNSGSVYFTNIVATSYQIPIYIPGYNNMEGYGQGSGLLVSLLKPFTTLHANMVLYNWSTLQNGILSFQINAMNYYGATRSTCVGFFQLGIDLDPNGTIAPWYVEGTNCYAHYFIHSNSPALQPGFQTPNGTKLGLTIQDVPALKEIFFQITDYNVTGANRYWNATMPYQGTQFYATYTQMEFQPVAESQISGYHFSGSLYNMTYGSSPTGMTLLNNSYMLPFTLDAPQNWSLTYYDGTSASYNQLA